MLQAARPNSRRLSLFCWPCEAEVGGVALKLQNALHVLVLQDVAGRGTKSCPTGPWPTTSTRLPVSSSKGGRSEATCVGASELSVDEGLQAPAASKAATKPSDGFVGSAVRRSSSAFKNLTSSWAFFNSSLGASCPTGPRHHSGFVYSLIQSFLWMADQNLVASLPAQSKITWSPPG